MPSTTDPVAAPIQISSNAGLIDLLTAAVRLIAVVVGGVAVLLKLLGAHDLAGMIAYLQSQSGVAWLAALCSLASIAYGLYKTHKRGSQLASVAGDERVPDEVAQLK